MYIHSKKRLKRRKSEKDGKIKASKAFEGVKDGVDRTFIMRSGRIEEAVEQTMRNRE